MSRQNANALLRGSAAAPPGQTVWTVSQLSLHLKETLEALFPSVWVTGEITNLRRPRSGHIYLDLKDEAAVLHAVVWRSTAARLRFEPRDGQQVICRGAIDVYPPHGKYQLEIRRLEPLGEGALQVALRQLHDRLAAEGLFDAARKRPLPPFPRRIAIVTSATGAAVRDFIHVAARRWRGVKILVIPARVQGDGAAAEIAAGIETANRLAPRPDILVVSRGGGSLEDLWCFNEELLVRAIHASQVPVISAVGHEIDVTLSDLAADIRAPTPSAAAELAVPDERELRNTLTHHEERLRGLLQSRAAQARDRLEALARHRVFRRPLDWLRQHAQRLDELEGRSRTAIRRQLQTAQHRAAALAGQLESLSPLAVLNRGYSLTIRERDGQIIRAAGEVAEGDAIRSRLAEGEIFSRVERARGASD